MRWLKILKTRSFKENEMSRKNREKRRGASIIRTPEQLKLMRKSGKITAAALKKVILSAQVGVNLQDLEKIAEEEILRLGGEPSFKTVPNYHWATCLAVNDEVVHGIPRNIVLKDGDVLGIDLGAIYQGWYTDAAWSTIIGKGSKEKENFLKVGEKALWNSVHQTIEGNRIGDISFELQKEVESAGFSIVRNLTGHGVGHSYHEEPEIPGIGTPGTGILLKSGMTLAIEAIYTQGRGEIYEKEDGWTIASVDGSLAGLFEMTVVVGKEKAEILTDWRSF